MDPPVTARTWPEQQLVHDATPSPDPGPQMPLLSARPLSDTERRAASLTVAAYSTGAEDCRELLHMLGLLEVPATAERRRG
jgi:hypothetical protein